MDQLEVIEGFKIKVALIPPSFIGQFDSKYSPSDILSAIRKLGFDRVYEVSYGAEVLGKSLVYLLRENPNKQFISSACPTITKLVAKNFPLLFENIVPLKAPLWLTAEKTRMYLHKQGYEDSEIGLFFITPCTAKATEVYNEASEDCKINGTISISEVIHDILKTKAIDQEPTDKSLHSEWGQGWAISGGEAAFLDKRDTLHVNGISNVIQVLEEIERGEHNDIRFFELNACTQGCVGGCLMVTNPCVAKHRIAVQMDQMGKMNPAGVVSTEQVYKRYKAGLLSKEYVLMSQPAPTEDLAEAIERLSKVEAIYESLPKFDCCSCGSPGCRAMAEDIANGNATEMDCVFMLKDAITRLSKNMLEISSKVMPIMSIKDEENR
jgi:iron only hydrogenase large subunit-like protein